MSGDDDNYAAYAYISNRIKEPTAGSTMLGNFLSQHHRDLAFTLGLEFADTGLDHVARLAGSSLIEFDWSEHPIGEAKALEGARMAAASMAHRAKITAEIRSLTDNDLANTIVSRYADNLNSYLTELLGAALKKYPKTVVESDARVSIQEVLQHGSLDDFREWLIDRKVTELSYQGLPKLEEYWKSKFKFDLVPDEHSRSRISFLLAARNLITHRRAVIDRRFMAAMGETYGKNGTRIQISKGDAGRLICATVETVVNIDKRAAEKFGLHVGEVTPDRIGKMHRDFLDSVSDEVARWDGT